MLNLVGKVGSNLGTIIMQSYLGIRQTLTWGLDKHLPGDLTDTYLVIRQTLNW